MLALRAMPQLAGEGGALVVDELWGNGKAAG